MELCRFVGKQRPDHFRRALSCFEDNSAGQVECRILDVCTRQCLHVMLSEPEHNASDATQYIVPEHIAHGSADV